MRAPISIVIPTLNAGPGLPATLGALGDGLEAGLIREVIISDGGSRDDTKQIATSAGAVWVEGPAGRGGQLRRGAAVAGGDWLLMLHADTLLSKGWADAVRNHIRDDPNDAGYFKLAFGAQGVAPKIVERWANFRSRRIGLPYGDQGLLISRKLYDGIRGYPDIPLMEDVAIARILKRRLRQLPATAWTSAARYERRGWLRQGAGNLMTLLRYLSGTHPDKLAAKYNSEN